MPSGNPLLPVELNQQQIWPSKGQIKPAMSETTKSCFQTLAHVLKFSETPL